MTKKDAIQLFGTPAELAAALGITRHAIYQWPDELPQDQIDRVLGAALRMGKVNGEQATDMARHPAGHA